MDPEQSRTQERIREYYDRLAPDYDRVGPRVMAREGRRLVELAGVTAGARVLDVAPGRGAVLFPAAERAGTAGSVVGVDLAPSMVRETSADIERLGLRQAAMRRMDAERLEFPDATFDFALCGYGLFFFPRLPRALAEVHRVLKPEGRFGASTDTAPDPRWAWYAELRRAFGAEQALFQELAEAAEVIALLEQAGFVGVRVIEEEWEVVYADAEAWWSAQLPGLRILLAAEALDAFKAEALKRLRPLIEPAGIPRLSRARYFLATKPKGQ